MTRTCLIFASTVTAALLGTSCKANYKQEFAGNTPLRIRNLSQHTVEAVRLVPETRHNESDNWLTSPITPNGEVTFTIKDGGYWFHAKGSAGPVKIDTGTSMNSRFGKLIIVKGATELILFDRTTQPSDTQNSQSRITFSFDTAAPADGGGAPGTTPATPTPADRPTTEPATPTTPAGSGSAAAPPPS